MFRVTDYFNSHPALIQDCQNIDFMRRYLACALKIWRRLNYRIVRLGELQYQINLHGVNVEIKAERVK